MFAVDIEVSAAHPNTGSSRALDWIFGCMFRGLIYNQVWEDPLVDLAALSLNADHRIVMIGSAGCNALAYLSADVKRIDAVDINAAHRALFSLKRTALERLPHRDAMFRMFGAGQGLENVQAYDTLLAPHLPQPARAYWSGRGMTGDRRIGMFRTGFYHHGLLHRFIGLTHRLAKMSGCNPKLLVQAVSLEDQALLFTSEVAPVFSTRFARAVARSHLSLFALGIPPAQYERLDEGADNNLSALLIKRIEHLACNFPITENPFAWQVFARRYGSIDSKAIPLYLEAPVYDAIQPRAGRVNLHATLVTDYLKAQSSGSVHRFVLLDSQDWMSPQDVAALWSEIERTAHPEDARVLFRTAGPFNPFHSLPEELRRAWTARDDLTPAFTAADRTALYSGVHLIERRSAKGGV
jgi:S-adenosylmethionine-diacylglycerol 3-amino-3-carboxypropyl transferase